MLKEFASSFLLLLPRCPMPFPPHRVCLSAPPRMPDATIQAPLSTEGATHEGRHESPGSIMSLSRQHNEPLESFCARLPPPREDLHVRDAHPNQKESQHPWCNRHTQPHGCSVLLRKCVYRKTTCNVAGSMVKGARPILHIDI